MLLRHSLGLEAEAAPVESAVEGAVAAGVRTADIAVPGQPPVGSSAVTDAILERLVG